MRLHSLTLRGVSTAFKASTVHIDFDTMPAGLVAFVGANGSGKTTLLEASGPLLLYRRSPSYDEPFVDRIVPGVRDAVATLDFSLGATRYETTVRADPMAGGGRGKTEAVLTTGDDVAGPLVREYDAAVAKILPPEDVFLASAFAAQGGVGSFFAMKPGERRDVLAVLLGLERLQVMAEYARDRHAGVMRDLAVLDEGVQRAAAAWKDAERLRA
jgi:DNA repair exonuclease SbcCD ATPase subunit